ncbi:MAG: hypothetical protein HGB04_06740 [Chlorobiaceae bacterium]|nr:hypothetical protein [Chlorobiaceae bacterium]
MKTKKPRLPDGTWKKAIKAYAARFPEEGELSFTTLNGRYHRGCPKITSVIIDVVSQEKARKDVQRHETETLHEKLRELML